MRMSVWSSDVCSSDLHADVFHSGTFAANPVTMAGGIATLKQLRDGDPYELLEVLGAELDHRMSDALQDAGSPYGFIRRGSVFSLVLVPGRKRLYNHAEVAEQDTTDRKSTRLNSSH